MKTIVLLAMTLFVAFLVIYPVKGDVAFRITFGDYVPKVVEKSYAVKATEVADNDDHYGDPVIIVNPNTGAVSPGIRLDGYVAQDAISGQIMPAPPAGGVVTSPGGGK